MAKKKSSQKMTRKTSKKTRKKTGALRTKKGPTTKKESNRVKKAAKRKAASGNYGARTDYGAGADGYFAAIDSPRVKGLATWLRKIVRRSLPQAQEAIKWGIPCYTDGGLVCAIVAQTSYASIQFYEAGTSISDPRKLLEGSGKRCRHVKVREQRADLGVELARMVQEAGRLVRS